MPDPTSTISIDGRNHLVVHQPGHADIRIDTADAGDIHRKLEQLGPAHLALLLQIAAEQQGKMPGVFTTLLRGVAAQKNVVQNSTIQANTVSIGDRIEYHFHLEEKTAVLPKKLSTDIPTLSLDAVVGRSNELKELRRRLLEKREALPPLVRLEKLQLWDDRDIDAGDEWEKVIFQQLEEADIVICLVSADFVASDFCYKKEFGAALDAHQKGEKTIVPVMLRKTNWQDLPIAKIQGAPGEWITSATNKDEAWTKVSESLQTAIEKAKQHRRWVKESRYHTI